MGPGDGGTWGPLVWVFRSLCVRGRWEGPAQQMGWMDGGRTGV